MAISVCFAPDFRKGPERHIEFIRDTKNISEVGSTISKRAGELSASVRPMLRLVNSDLNQVPTAAWLCSPSPLRPERAPKQESCTFCSNFLIFFRGQTPIGIRQGTRPRADKVNSLEKQHTARPPTPRPMRSLPPLPRTSPSNPRHPPTQPAAPNLFFLTFT